MRQEGVRVASGRRQDNLASGWRQDDVKRRGARINWRGFPFRLQYPELVQLWQSSSPWLALAR